MNGSKKSLFVSLLITLMGVAWLLNTLDIIPRVDWIWTIGVSGLGILILTLGGWNRISVVVGMFLVFAGTFSILRQTGRMRPEIEVPCLVIVFGALLLTVQLVRVPLPKWLEEAKRAEAMEEAAKNNPASAAAHKETISR
jgi:hypothetical protein